MTITPEKILMHAHDLVRERGLCKGHETQDCTTPQHRGGLCAGTAIDDAYEALASTYGWCSHVHAHAENAFMFVTNSSTPREFNDEPGITLNQVCAAFKRAAYMSRLYHDSAPRGESA